jgi:predicted phage-related endonuclease
MRLLNLEQGSDEWLQARLKFNCASEAAAIFNEHKFISRNQLLDAKKGWLANPNSSFKEMIFERGHEHEALARVITEDLECESFPPMVCLKDKYLASFDGVNISVASRDHAPQGFESECEVTQLWEHKDWNLALAENVRNGVLEPHYYWQLEHQCLVADHDEVLFVVSDGTIDNRVEMTYVSTPERRKKLIKGWVQFNTDLKSHELKAKRELIIPNEAELFPIITFEFSGLEIVSNINECLIDISERANLEMNAVLETDQDFADKEKTNKATKEARDNLKRVVESVKGKFVSFSEFEKAALEIDSVLQKMQSQGERQVKKSKEDKKQKIQDAAKIKVDEFVDSVNLEIKPLNIRSVLNCNLDFNTAMKNKRTIESIENAVDSLISELKISINDIKDLVVSNLESLRVLASEYKFLFRDTSTLVLESNESLKAVIKTRIADYEKDQEAKKIEDERVAKIEAENAAQKKPEPKTENILVENEKSVQANDDEVVMASPNMATPHLEIEDLIIEWFSTNTEVEIDDVEFIVNAMLDGEIPHVAII